MNLPVVQRAGSGKFSAFQPEISLFHSGIVFSVIKFVFFAGVALTFTPVSSATTILTPDFLRFIAKGVHIYSQRDGWIVKLQEQFDGQI